MPSTPRARRTTVDRPSRPIAPRSPYDGDGRATTARRADRYISEVRRALGHFGRHRPVPKGASLFDPDGISRHLYIVESGMIDVCLAGDQKSYPIASFHPGASFIFDFGGHHIAVCQAAEDSMVIDVPLARLRRLHREGVELDLLLEQCHAFDLKSFLELCYPARSRVRLARAAGTGRRPAAERDSMARPEGDRHAAGRAAPCLAEEPAPKGSGRRRPVRRRGGRRARLAHAEGRRDAHE